MPMAEGDRRAAVIKAFGVRSLEKPVGRRCSNNARMDSRLFEGVMTQMSFVISRAGLAGSALACRALLLFQEGGDCTAYCAGGYVRHARWRRGPG